MSTYPHHQILIEWLNGATIQYKEGDDWIDCPNVDRAEKVPHLYREGVDYRLKPVIIRWRTCLMKDKSVDVASSLAGSYRLERDSNFDRWISDWHEVVL